ncbi:MAG TPA: RsbRD N-terminal domain-containing protein, partial [Myxococcota bacterium]|nr:RsbRD N-terminal domain-containing protein [Myxococcota bacterium]
MASNILVGVQDLIARDEPAILENWLKEQLASTSMRSDLINDDQLRGQSKNFLRALREGMSGNSTDINGAVWTDMRALLTDLSRQRVRLGFSPSDTARFVFSLKQALFSSLRSAFANKQETLTDAMWQTTTLLDNLGLFTTEAYQLSREEVIKR